MNSEFSATQKRALLIATAAALIFAAYFLRGYFTLVVVACVFAYLFNPLFNLFQRRLGKGMSVTLTLLSALGVVIIPFSLLVLLAVAQISAMVRSISAWVSRTDLSSLGDKALEFINRLIDRVPFLSGVDITPDLLRDRMATIAQHAGEYALGGLQGAVGGLAGGLTSALLFVYVFISLLSNRERIQTLIRQLNPLGDEVTDLYLHKMGAMVHGTVLGQFVIALAQGIAGAASIYIAGFHQGFFIFAILLSALSVIPLGGGIVTIPFGIGMILYGNVFGGVFVIVWHLLVVTNIDNVLRPILVPRAARLDSALMLLAVFAGLTMFGFLGIVIGPVLMIVIVTTISVYLAVFKGVPIDAEPGDSVEDEQDDEPKEPGPLQRLVARAWARITARQAPRHDAGAATSAPSAETSDAHPPDERSASNSPGS